MCRASAQKGLVKRGDINSHLMIIPANSEREAAVYYALSRVVVRILERTRRDEGVVCRVERDRSELLPVSHVGLLG